MLGDGHAIHSGLQEYQICEFGFRHDRVVFGCIDGQVLLLDISRLKRGHLDICNQLQIPVVPCNQGDMYENYKYTSDRWDHFNEISTFKDVYKLSIHGIRIISASTKTTFANSATLALWVLS